MKKKLLSVLLISVLALGLVACGSSSGSSDTENNNTTSAADDTNASEGGEVVETATGIPLTSSDLKVVVGEQGYYVIPIILDQGWFEEVFEPSNITIEVADFNNGPEMIEAFTAEQLDFGFMGMQPGISGVANDAGISVIASFCDSEPGIIITTLKDSGITSVAELKGKTVAATIGSNGYSLLLKALADEGLSLDTDVNFVNIDYSSAPAVLESGEVDAVVGYQTGFDAAILADGDIFHNIKDATGYGISANILAARNKFTEEHADVVNNLLVIIQWAYDYINENHDEAVTAIANYYGIEESVVERGLELYTYDWIGTDKLTADIDNYIQFMYDNELISKRIEVNDVVDFSFYEETIKQ